MKKIALAIALILSLNVSNVWGIGNSTNSGTRTIKAPRFARPLVEKWISEYAKVEPGIQFIIAKGSQQDIDLNVVFDNQEANTKDFSHHIVYFGETAVLPIAARSSEAARLLEGKHLNSKKLKQLFFLNDDLEEDTKKNKQFEQIIIYSGSNASSVAAPFAENFGEEASSFRGKRISGDDLFLNTALNNVVPEYARVSYYIRSPKRDILNTLTEWIDSAAVGAAKGTQTRLEKEIVAGTYERLHNKTLSKVIQKNLEQVGGVIYDARERKFAEELARATGNPDTIVNQAAKVQPLAEFPEEGSGGSSDVGDVSWVVPLASFGAATFVPGSPGHSWQNVAADGTTIGTKGLLNASRVFALTAIDLFTDSKLLQAVKDEFKQVVGSDFKYVPLLGDRKPALDYRVSKKE